MSAVALVVFNAPEAKIRPWQALFELSSWAQAVLK